MCGIVGVIDYQGWYTAGQLEELTRAMRDTLSHRGPDDAGLWTSSDGRVCLGHRRLAVIDRRAEGRQPMVNEDGRVAVTFNGEIYNFRALRQTLEQEGHRFASRTDTEVLCHLFEEGDPDEAVASLRGMFALAAWREADRRLLLARDPFGKKPLYFVRHGAFLAFASELRALTLLEPRLLGGIDPEAVQQYLLLQYVPAPRSIYRHARKLEPGTTLRLDFAEGRVRGEAMRRFFRFEPATAGPAHPPRRQTQTELIDEGHSLLVQAVRSRLVADVPLGAFLSGGNDSSLVVAVMARELGASVRTYSVGFRDWPGSEHLAARQIAGHLGTEHHELIVEPSAVDLLPDIVAALDEPNGDSSCLPVYLLSRFARRNVTVALSGDGGDEVFGGYDRYTQTVREAVSLRERLRWMKQHRRWWTAGRAYLGERILPMPERPLRNLVGRLLPGTERLLAEMRAVLQGPGPLLHRLRQLDAATYLPGAVLAKVDRMSMQFALEVRSPLLDVDLARWAQQLPAAALNDGVTGKKILKQLALRYLPEEIVYRRKQGFGLPDQCWSHDALAELAGGLLLGAGCQLHAHLDAGKLREHLERQRRARSFDVYQLWELLVLEQWLRKAASREPPTCPAARSESRARPLVGMSTVAVHDSQE